MDSTLPKLWEIYEKEGKFYFDGLFAEHRTRFGPYEDSDKAECDAAQAEAMA